MIGFKNHITQTLSKVDTIPPCQYIDMIGLVGKQISNIYKGTSYIQLGSMALKMSEV